MISIGGAMLCRQCEPRVMEEINRLRAEGKPVNTMHIARRIYKEEYAGGDYLIRDVPKEMWDRAKHRAVDDNMSLRDLVLIAVREYLDK
jgi:hypothetical protein